MSRIVSNLTMRTKLTAMLAVPLVGLVVLGLTGIADKRAQARDAAKTQALIGLSSKIGAYLHESQKERGLTGLFLAAKGVDSGDDLRAQRQSTDRALNALRAEVRATASDQDAALRARLASLEKDTTATIAADSSSAQLSRSLGVYATLLGAKEAAGIERATLAGALRAGRFADAATLRAFVSASATEDQKLH